MTDVLTTAAMTDWLNRAAADLSANADWLTELDSAIGDADHGTNMARGSAAVVARLSEKPATTVQELLKGVGMTLVSKVGGASGSLYGTLFLEMGRQSPAEGQIDAEQLASALRAGVDAVVSRGHAEVGDKTMIDALTPALAALSESLAADKSIVDALAAASEAAAAGRDSTKPLVARKGRASYLGERSAGHLDPGAASAAILVAALATAADEAVST